VDLDPETWVQYVRDGHTGRAVVKQRLHPEDPKLETVEIVETGVNVPHSFIVNADYEGNDVFIGTSHGLGWGIGEGYYPRLQERAPLEKIVAVPVADQKTSVAARK
jgi:hypothetical protein